MEFILDAVLDTLKVFPFLLLIYILIELLENKTTFTHNHKVLQGPLAPLLGTATGLIPQCGFSVMAAKLYDKSFIRTGTLLAVFIATSDEAVVLLLSSGTSAVSVMPLIAVKLVVGLAVGYVINAILKNEYLAEIDEHEEVHGYSCGREHEGKTAFKVYFIEPLLHSLKIAAYLLVVNLLLGALFTFVGEEPVVSFMKSGEWFQPLFTSLVGLIPNCASSVLITQTYISGGIAFGSCVAGLCTNAGLGFVVLLKNTKKAKRNILLIITIYLIAVATGYAVNGIMALGGWL